MENEKSLATMNQQVSAKLLESMYLLDILEDLLEGNAKESIILSLVIKNIEFSFDEISECRKIIS